MEAASLSNARLSFQPDEKPDSEDRTKKLILSRGSVAEKERNTQLHEATKHMGLAIVGIGVSVAYMILSSIEHFFKGGFGLAVFGLLASSLYCYFSWRTLKLQR